ncbi:hypothetical protein C7445_102294 [Alicyclobacillus sacchari]|uniref:Uncharacterized protein n=1 Tax=Alicyclobacillus sacchari TaxID=392010 RepID=A0A4R8LT28_9BACL|nr:hypothetical protein [Alicyclobacillus sacchari]TDY50734.1 hypothetical protein C7445_102294 [Alicyclobacillus sacchari]GMA55726.1 hypothetical protein GCM10025858_02290 [Alicyclobacillus sacchari]
MCTRAQCERAVGQWVRFQTPWGTHRGVVEQVTGNGVLVRVPRSYAPVGLASGSDEDRLDVTLAQWGYGYPYARPYGRWGYPGYGYWYGGWWWWWLAFAWIFWLAFLW